MLRIAPKETEINSPCSTASFQRLTQRLDDVVSTHLKTEECIFNETMPFILTHLKTEECIFNETMRFILTETLCLLSYDALRFIY